MVTFKFSYFHHSFSAQTDGVDASPSHSRQEVNHIDTTVSSTANTSTELVVNGHSSRDESQSDMENCQSSTPVVPRNHHVPDELSLNKSGVNSAVSTPLLERSYDSLGVRPKMRKKRAAPRPPQEENKTVVVVSIRKKTNKYI